MNAILPYISAFSGLLSVIVFCVGLMIYLKNKESKDKEQDVSLKDLDKRFNDYVLKDKDHENSQTLVINDLNTTIKAFKCTMEKIETSLDTINGNMLKMIIAGEKAKEMEERLKLSEERLKEFEGRLSALEKRCG